MHLLEDDANRNFYRHVKCFSPVEKPKEFDVANYCLENLTMK